MEVLPTEAWWYIFQFLDFVDLGTAALVCSQWRDLASDDQLWKSLCAQRNWNIKPTNWKHCFHQHLDSLKILNERLAPGLDDFLKVMRHLYCNGGAEISSSKCVEFFKQYFKNNKSEGFLRSMEEISWMNASYGFRTINSTMVETCVVEKTVAIPRSDVVDLILNLNHRILWDQAMYGGQPLQSFLKHCPLAEHSPTSIPKGFESIADDLKLLSIDAADMYWNIGGDAKLELLHLRCFRGVYSILEDGLLLLEEGMWRKDDSFFTEPIPDTTTYQEDEILKKESTSLPHYQNADRFVVQATGFYLQRMGPSTTKIIYLVQLVTDEFDMMVLEMRQRLRTLCLTRMANYYRTPTYKAVKNGTALPMDHQAAPE